MTTETPEDRVKSAYCLYCKKPRFADEMRPATGMRGQRIKRCTHCLALNKPQAPLRS